MTRKDYILIAGALHDVISTVGGSSHDIIMAWKRGVEQSAEAIATRLASDNPRFSREHFLAVVRGEKELNSCPSRRF